MNKLNKSFKIFCSSVLLLVVSSCTTVVIHDAQIRTHWIKKGEIAPFDGVLLNSYTFYQLLTQLNKCKNSNSTPTFMPNLNSTNSTLQK
jgi:hypothetical protein